MAPTYAQEHKLNISVVNKPNKNVKHSNKNVANENSKKLPTEIFETVLHLQVGDVTQQ